MTTVAAKKPTPTQLAVLRAVAAGDVYRSESGNTLYKSFHSGTGQNVTRHADTLAGQRLIRIGERRGGERLWHIEPAGETVLAEHDSGHQR